MKNSRLVNKRHELPATKRDERIRGKFLRALYANVCKEDDHGFLDELASVLGQRQSYTLIHVWKVVNRECQPPRIAYDVVIKFDKSCSFGSPGRLIALNTVPKIQTRRDRGSILKLCDSNSGIDIGPQGSCDTKHNNASDHRPNLQDDLPVALRISPIPLAPCLDCLSKFLDNPHPARAEIADLFRKSIQQGTLIHEESSVERGSNYQIPKLFSQESCFQPGHIPDDTQALADVIMDPDKAYVHWSGHSREASNSDLDLMRLVRSVGEGSMCHPDEAQAIINGNLKSRIDGMVIPDALRTTQSLDPRRKLLCSAVVATEHFLTDLHIDHGWQALSIPLGGCVKLWAMYPPTDHNLSHFYCRIKQAGRFLSLASSLEDPYFAVTLANQAVWMPAGWIHAVYTLRAGVLVGINWNAAEDINVVSNIVEKEHGWDLDDASIVSFVDTCEAFLHSDDDDGLKKVMEACCGLVEILGETLEKEERRLRSLGAATVSKSAFRKLAKRLERHSCPKCGNSFKDHVDRILKRSTRRSSTRAPWRAH